MESRNQNLLHNTLLKPKQGSTQNIMNSNSRTNIGRGSVQSYFMNGPGDKDDTSVFGEYNNQPQEVNNDIMFEKNTRKGKRIKLEEEKEVRIQEFLAAKRREYEKYQGLDFDYKVIEEEIKKMEMIDYTKLNYDQERIRQNKASHQNNLLTHKEDGMAQNNPENQKVDITNESLQKIRVYITPLHENFVQNDEALKSIPADNMNHPVLGQPKYCGTVFKRSNDKGFNEEVWVVVRGFYLFIYNEPKSLRPIHVIRIPLTKLGLEIAKVNIPKPEIGIPNNQIGLQPDPNIIKNRPMEQVEFQYFAVSEKPGSQLTLHFYIGRNNIETKYPRHNFYDFMKKQVAIKSYLFLCGYLNVAPDQNLLRFFENDEATILKINFQTQIIDSMIQVHSVLKPVSEAFFYYTFIVTSNSKNIIVIDFSNLGLWSKFLAFFFKVMREESVRCPVEIIKIDNNDITDEVLNELCAYMLLPHSFFLRHLSLNNSDFGDSGTQIIGRMISDRHLRIRNAVHNMVNYQLPLEYLGMNNVKMGDQGLYNLKIHLEKVQKDNLNRGIYDYDVHMELHLAQNLITEKSLSSLGNLLQIFQGVRVLNISESKQIMCIQKEMFFEQLKNNYSLQTLNISKIDMNIDSFRSLISLLEVNYTLINVEISLTELMIQEIAKSNNIKLLKYFMISYNPNLIFDNL